MKKIFIFLFLAISSLSFAQPGWYFLNPTPTGNTILEIKMFSEFTGICITAKEVLRTTNGGVNWNKVNTTWVASHNSLSMVDSLNGYMAIDSSTILKTTNGGVNWYYTSRIQKSRIGKIYFISDKTGFALQFENNYYNNSWRGKIFRTTTGGKHWDSVKTPGSYELKFYEIFFSSSATGFVTGKQYVGSNLYRSVMLKTTNNGEKWDSISNFSNFDFGHLYFTDNNTGFTGGNYHLMKTTNGGLNWGYINHNQANIKCIQFLNENTGFVSAAGNRFAKTTNGGTNWIYNNVTVVGIFDFINASTGIGTADIGKIIKTSNSGVNWINYSKSSFNNYSLVDVDFCDKDNGYILDWWSSKILRTTNGGMNWNETSFQNIVSIANVNPNVCYLTTETNNIMYKTTNGGLNWNTLSLNTPIVFNTKFLNENTGFGVCKYGYFFKTTNGGKSFTYKDSLTNYESGALDFIDENTGMIGGSNVYKTTDGGISWVQLNFGTRMYDVKFVSKNKVFAIGGYGEQSAVYKSTNGGLNWQSTNLPDLQFGSIAFPDSLTGYARGYIKMYKTTNSGENWFRVNSGYAYSLQSFDFINSLTGYSVGGNGVILKTTDGGGFTSSIPVFPEYIPEKFSLYQNYPNPFNPSTKIKFDLPQRQNQNNVPVKIIVFDILGRKMETLLDENLQAGAHEINWNASNYGTGVYFYMLLTDDIKETKKMILIK